MCNRLCVCVCVCVCVTDPVCVYVLGEVGAIGERI